MGKLVLKTHLLDVLNQVYASKRFMCKSYIYTVVKLEFKDKPKYLVIHYTHSEVKLKPGYELFSTFLNRIETGMYTWEF